jgi:gliding motility-associated-like protein
MFDPKAAGAGTYLVRYTFNGTNGCSNYKEQPITVHPLPEVNAGPDRFMLEGGNTTLQATASGNNLNYTWSPSTALSDPRVLQPIASPVEETIYKLEAESADGCSASDEVVVKVLKMPAIPNVFTPNGDGINDKWEIAYLESYPGSSVKVFNRYGQLVFESKGYGKPWDGKYNGKDLPAGTYYYIVDPKNGRKQIAGYVDIVR